MLVDSNIVHKPRALRAGAHLRVLSLSAPIAALCPRRFERGCDYLRQLGFQVSLAPTTTERWQHMAGRPEHRARDFVAAWLDPEVDGILSVIGGHSTHQILEHVPFERLSEPKAFIGYSDTTTLQMALYARCRHVTFHGPALMPQFGEFGGPWPATLESFLDATQSPASLRKLASPGQRVAEHLRWETEDDRPRRLEPIESRNCLRPGEARGRLLIANMGCLLLLAGTPFFPDCRGAILVLEDDESETVESIDRYLTQLRHLGVWSQIGGLVVGRFPEQVGLSENALEELLLRATQGMSFPILTGFEIGHVDPALTVPIGVLAELNATARELTQLEKATAG